MSNGGWRMAKVKDEAEVPAELHAAELTVWDVPSAIVAGERFKAMVGLRCSGGCNIGGRELSIYDQQGALVGGVRLGREVWPGTEALYFAEMVATAPLATGGHQWEVRIAGWDSEMPHAAGSFPFSMRVVSPPDCLVTVKAVDRESQVPIRGACVVMHPYRATTDESGIAQVRVARGQYDILVSGARHIPVYTSVEVNADLTTSAELDAEQPWANPEEALE
jgi:hypothetical protein